MSRYQELIDSKNMAETQLSRYSEIQKTIYSDHRRFLSGAGTGSLRIPGALHSEFDELMVRCQAHYLAEIEEANRRLAACDTLLAGFDAKQGSAP